MDRRRFHQTVGVGLAAGLFPWPVIAARREDRGERSWTQVVDDAIGFLRKAQAADGSFSGDRSIGITGVVVTGLLSTGRVDVNDPMLVKALAYIEKLINPEEGHLAGSNPRQQLKNYVTSVNVMALAAANQDGRYREVVAGAARFLKMLQWDEGEGIQPSNSFYGGFGYDSKNRPDLSNGNFAVEALKAAGVPPSDPVWQRAVVFVSRCQNFKSEHQDQPWAAKINDGSFIYSAAGDGETKADPLPDGGLPGYGSMTYAGIKSLIYAGVDKNDPRVQTALAWIRRNYTVDANPGMPASRSQFGLYYYYHTMAKCLTVLGIQELEDEKGIKHDWRRDLRLALARRQRPDGSWVNEQDRWMEGDACLVTGYALMALAYCKP
jgi:squalene-hopene/tetraprenyl-beta-curcumene cyclase